jgi:hypothetical protein
VYPVAIRGAQLASGTSLINKAAQVCRGKSTKSDLEFRTERINYEGNLSLQNLKCFYDGTFIAEEYTNGHPSFHLHVGSIGACAFEHVAAPVRDVGAAPASRANEFPMLVWVRDVAQGLRPVDSFVRLAGLDCIYVRVRKVSQWPLVIVSRFPMFGEFVFDSDRELCSTSPDYS